MKLNQDLSARFEKAMSAAGLPPHPSPSESQHACPGGVTEPSGILLAVSGGPDSMGLAALLMAWQAKQGEPRANLFAVVVDHGLRQGSDDEADMVAETLTQFGLPTHVIRITSPKPAAGFAEWARQQRYEVLRQEALRRHAVLLTAHHQDDQLETIEMRLSRGSGLRGLAGMATETRYLGVRLIRPCLGFRKQELADIARQAGLSFIQDPTNHDERFERPRIRTNRPLRNTAGIADSHLLRLSQYASRIITPLDRLLMSATPPWMDIRPEGFIKMPRRALSHRGFPHMVRKTLQHMMAKPYPPRDEAMEELALRLKSGKDATLGGCEWRLDSRWPEDIIICRETDDMSDAAEFDHGKGVFDGRWLIAYPAPVRVEPLGRHRFAALKRRFPHKNWPFQAMPRAFWSMPVLIGDKNKNLQDHGCLLLDDGALFPHLIKNNIKASKDAISNTAYQTPLREPIAAFIGGWNG